MTQQIIDKNSGALFKIAELLTKNVRGFKGNMSLFPEGNFSWQRFFNRYGINNPELKEIISVNSPSRPEKTYKILTFFYENSPEEFAAFLTHLIEDLANYRNTNFENSKLAPHLSILGYSIEENEIKSLKSSISSRLSSWPDVQIAYDGVVSIYRTRGPNWERMTIEGLRTTYETLLREITRYIQKEKFTGKFEEDCVIGKYLHVIDGLGNGYRGEARKNEFDILCWFYRFCSSHGTHSQEVVSSQDAEFAKKVGDILIDRILVRLNR
jgi:hypothetical protein